MHDAAIAYDRDTYVVDLDEGPSLPRASTEELEMQTYVQGAWHRRMPDLSETSCGQSIDSPRAPVRRNELRGDLCPICHTERELLKTAENYAKENDTP